jgi:hypothetical protein
MRQPEKCSVWEIAPNPIDRPMTSQPSLTGRTTPACSLSPSPHDQAAPPTEHPDSKNPELKKLSGCEVSDRHCCRFSGFLLRLWAVSVVASLGNFRRLSPNRCKSLLFSPNRCFSLRFSPNRCVFRRISPNRCVCRQIVALSLRFSPNFAESLLFSPKRCTFALFRCTFVLFWGIVLNFF